MRRLPFRYADAVPSLARLLLGGSDEGVVPSPRLVEAAAYHRVGAHLLAAEKEGRASLPAELKAELGRHEWALVQRSASHLASLPTLALAISEACGVPPIVLKGPDAAALYPSRTLRAYGDLDLLVPRCTLAPAAASIERLGYEPLNEFRTGFGAEHGHDVHLVSHSNRGPIDVELHWRLGDDPCAAALDYPGLVEAAEALDGVPGVLRPGPEGRLLVFAVHFLSDRKRRLAWANDVRLAALAAPTDVWERVFDRDDALPWVLHRALDRVEGAFGPVRERPSVAGPPPPFGPIRAIDAWGAPASLHVGRLATLGWRERGRYLVQVTVPSRSGLEGTVGGDGAPTWRLALRHARKAAGSLLGRH